MSRFTITTREDAPAAAQPVLEAINAHLAAHAFASSKMTRMTDDDIALGRSGSSTDPKRAAAARFAQELVNSRGRVSDADLAAVREIGYSDPQILAIVALSVSFLMTNYLNNVIETDIDLTFVEGAAA
jgi:alkylhydroperoxidase family enzyme